MALFDLWTKGAKKPFKSTTGTDGDIMKAGYPKTGVKSKIKKK